MTDLDQPSSSTPSTTTEYYFIFWPFGGISVFCFCIGLPINLFSLAYFVMRIKAGPTYVCLLYIFMNIVDLLICLLCLPMAVTNFSGGKELFYSISFLCSMWGYLWQILIRLSVFSVGLMSICRTISLSLPFLRLSKRYLFIPTIVYLVILMVLQSIPWWFNKSYFFMNSLCTWTLWFDVTSVEYKVLHILLVLLPFILPIFPIVISCFISVVKLKTDTTNSTSWSTKVGNEHAAQARKSKRSATITIVVITVAYIIFNVPYCLLMLDEVVSSLSEGRTHVTLAWFDHSTPYYYEMYLLFTIYAIPLNSTVNSIIYILRIKNLRCYIWNILTCTCRGGIPTLSTQPFSAVTVGNKVGAVHFEKFQTLAPLSKSRLS